MLTIVWGDPRSGEPGGETRYMLALPDGRTASLQVGDNTALLHFGQRVIVTGRAAAGPPAAAGPADAGTLIVDRSSAFPRMGRRVFRTTESRIGAVVGED